MVSGKVYLRYLRGPKDKGLVFQKTEGLHIVGYVDLDYAGDLDKRISSTGDVFTLGRGPVS